MKQLLLIVAIIASLNMIAQQPSNKPYAWKAQWITTKDIARFDYGVTMFRKSFQLKYVPNELVVHVSGDNRYRLYVNGAYVGYGPQMSDIRHWRYETLDIAPYLNPGDNVIAAEVINWGEDRPYGIISQETAFLLQSHTEEFSFLNTNDKTWKSERNNAYYSEKILWWNHKEIIGGFYAAVHGDSIETADYPWGWNTTRYCDKQWQNAEYTFNANDIGNSFKWILQPRTVANMHLEKETFSHIIRCEGMDNPTEFNPSKPVVVPPNTTVTLLVDFKKLTLGFPEMVLSQGQNAHIQIKYAENLFDKNEKKGNRNQLNGKDIIGFHDIIVSDGGRDRTIRPFYHRAFRFIQLKITTVNEQLIINDFYNLRPTAGIQTSAEFDTGNKMYQKIFDVCDHTATLGTQDNLMSDIYYETMQYVGDSWPHLMTLVVLTGDSTYYKNALQHFDYSRMADGNITSCYPLKSTFVHPNFSLIHINMMYDYMMHFGNKDFISQFVPDFYAVFDYFERRMLPNGLVGKTEWPYFIDWYPRELGGGGSLKEVEYNGNSATITLHLAYTMQNAADILIWLGKPKEAKRLREKANDLNKVTMQLCYDNEKGMLAETPDKKYFDQHPNILAVLSGAVGKKQQKELMERTMANDDIIPANLFFRFLSFKAIKAAGAQNMFNDVLAPWNKVIEIGMTGTPEKFVRDEPRSEAHPWASHPVYAYYHVICGIQPNFSTNKTVTISPDFCGNKFINAKWPIANGLIEMDLKPNNKNRIGGTVTIPTEIKSAIFKWNNKTIVLKTGKNDINL